MPQKWSKKRERQYEHIKDSAADRGASASRAREIAARTVNKNRAQSGESATASRSSTHDMSPQHRGGQRSGNRRGPGAPTRDQLYNEARQRNIKGRSTMTKSELAKALGRDWFSPTMKPGQ
jgi:plasmid stabilization system protein ParE